MGFVKRDQEIVWHPFTKGSPELLGVVRGQGSRLYLQDGRSLIDAISSWWCNIHGHCHPHIQKGLQEQSLTLDHVLFAGCTHPEAVRLAERLLELLPYKRVFYSDNGSTAVEIALKMALQYQFPKKRTQIFALKGGYHGDTFGAMAAGRSPFHEPFWPLLFDVTFIDLDSPPEIDEGALFIFEPHVQGASGMVKHDLEALDRLIGHCKERGVLTIADEVMTGFGRTGPLFVTDLLRNKPDFICLSKGLTGGVLPLAVTLTSDAIFSGVDIFLHGHTFTANPLACAAANRSLDLLLGEECFLSRRDIEENFHLLADKVKDHKKVRRVHATGTIFALEIASEKPLKDFMTSYFLEREILVRPLGNLLYFMPPYCVTKEELNHLHNTVLEVLNDICLI